VDDLADEKTGEIIDGLYIASTRTIKIRRNAAQLIDKIILHELMHAVTIHTLVGNTQLAQQGKDIYHEALKLVLQKYNVSSYEELKKLNPHLYGFKNELEFYAELYTSSRFIKELNTLGEIEEEPVSIWSRIKNFFLNILGIKRTSKLFRRASMYLDEIMDKSMTRGNALMEESIEYWEAIKDLQLNLESSSINIVTADALDTYSEIRQGLQIPTSNTHNAGKQD
jgi:hypothetical protein